MADKVILAEQEFAFAGYAHDGGPHLGLVAGKTYIVVWDGVEYTDTAIELKFNGYDAVGLGNPALVNAGSTRDFPFAIGELAAMSGSLFASDDPNSTSHRIAIYEAEDKQYLIYESTLTGIADAIRSKTESTDPIKAADMATLIEGISGGGGSVEGVHFVTFLSDDGTLELYKRPVADGDDCADPVARGLMPAPTKESTVQYNYTYSGWSLTGGGSANSNALKAVTEDKAVYAAYSSAVRKYTITYYDSDGTTVLKTESLAYGSTPSYVPEKSGASFSGWNPAVAPVTGNASYTAQWQEKITFAGGSWADIAAISESGKAAEYFAVGDEKVITYNNSVALTLQIAGFNHDDLADGSGKAGMTIICKDIPGTTSWNYNAKLYKDNMGNYLDINYKRFLPAELQSVLKQVNKLVDSTGNSGTSNTTTTLSTCLFLLSLDELNVYWNQVTGASDIRYYFSDLGSPYAIYASQQESAALRRKQCSDGQYGTWFTRQMWRSGSGATLIYYDASGKVKTTTLNTMAQHGFLFGFCI